MKTIITIEQSTTPSLSSVNTQAKTFDFMGHSVRIIMINDQPWFVATDVCNAIDIKNPSMAVKSLDNDELQVIDLHCPKFNLGGQNQALREMAASGVRKVNLISESGMYTLVLRCRDAVKEGTRSHQFKRWVTSEVLPSIRETGTYTKSVTPKFLTSKQLSTIRNEIRDIVRSSQVASASGYFINNLKIRFNVQKVDYIYSQDFDEVMQHIKEKEKEYSAFKYQVFLSEKRLLEDIIGEGAPLTRSISRQLKQEIQTGPPEARINWEAMAAKKYFEKFSEVFPNNSPKQAKVFANFLAEMGA